MLLRVVFWINVDLKASLKGKVNTMMEYMK